MRRAASWTETSCCTDHCPTQQMLIVTRNLVWDLGSIDLRHVLDQVHHAARVAPLVVVPRDELHEGRVQHDACLGIEGAGDGGSLKISGDQGLVAIAKEALHVTLRAPLDLCTDLLVRGGSLQLTRQVDDRHIDGRHAERHTRELALDRRDHLGHGLGRACRRRDDVARRRTATAPVLLRRTIHRRLRCCHCVDGRHQGPLDAELVVDALHQRRQPIRGARGARDRLHGRDVRLLVHAHHDGVRLVLGRRREHHLLRTRLQVRLNLLRRQEHTGGLANIVSAVRRKRDIGRIARVRQSHLVAIDHQGVPVDLDGAIVPAMNGVVLHLVGQVLRIVAGVDQLQLHLGVLHGDACHLTTNAPEAVDADANGMPRHRRRSAPSTATDHTADRNCSAGERHRCRKCVGCLCRCCGGRMAGLLHSSCGHTSEALLLLRRRNEGGRRAKSGGDEKSLRGHGAEISHTNGIAEESGKAPV
mmetsp:Transcript_60460/g.171258  ORF Transcript_60460/g.171258 Transcript_60460/m.171258 type:complete len:473 (-) Transcript_60460:56-1474(-)